MKTRLLIVTIAIAAVLIPAIAFASTANTNQIAAKKTSGVNKINAEISWFNKEITIINAKKNITTDRKSFLINIVNNDITIMNQMKTDIQNATDWATVRTDFNSITPVYDGLKSGIKSAVKA